MVYQTVYTLAICTAPFGLDVEAAREEKIQLNEGDEKKSKTKKRADEKYPTKGEKGERNGAGWKIYIHISQRV